MAGMQERVGALLISSGQLGFFVRGNSFSRTGSFEMDDLIWGACTPATNCDGYCVERGGVGRENVWVCAACKHHTKTTRK
jgi:hypothetical protein